MNDLLSGFSFFPVAAVFAALIYLPFFIVLRKKRKCGFLRHVVNYGLIGYVIMLVWITLTGAFCEGFANETHIVNLRPLTEFVAVYMRDEGMYLSQPMLNIIMFVPLGILLPFAFPKRVNRLYKAAAVIFATTVLIELIQYFIGRAADIDDVIANFTGGIAGYALCALLCAAFSKREWLHRLLPEYKRPSGLVLIAAALCVTAVFGVPAVMDMANARSEFGIVRMVTQRIPSNVRIDAALSSQTQNPVPVYTVESVDTDALARALANVFFPELEFEYEHYGQNTHAENRGERVTLSVYGEDGYYGVFFPDADGANTMADSALVEYAKGLAHKALREKESIGDVSLEKIENGRQISFAVNSHSDEANVMGGISLRTDGEFVYFYSGDVEIISETEALDAARGLSAYNYPCTDIMINSVELISMDRGRLRIPAYMFSGTAIYEGKRTEWVSFVDAVRR